MIIPVSIQISYFLSTVLGGFLMGILLQIYRITFNIKKPNRLLASVSDFLFWVLCSVCVFIFFLYTNNGNVGYYTFIGLFLGFILYLKLLSKPLDVVFRGITFLLMSFFRVLLNLFKYPIKCIKYLIKYIQYYIRKFFGYVFRKLTIVFTAKEEGKQE